MSIKTSRIIVTRIFFDTLQHIGSESDISDILKIKWIKKLRVKSATKFSSY